MALEPHGRAASIRSKAWSITQESIPPDREEPFWLKIRRSKQQRYYEVKISARGLKWANLQRYLQLEFGDEAILKDQPEMTVLKQDYVVILPRKLNTGEIQDIDLLKGRQEDVDEFLNDLEQEKKELEGLGPIPEDLEARGD